MTPPTVFGTLSRDGRTIQVLCPFCHCAHVHGSTGITDGHNRHRLSHCTGRPVPATPGYFITLAPDKCAKPVRT
jgi:hypothetical protein